MPHHTDFAHTVTERVLYLAIAYYTTYKSNIIILDTFENFAVFKSGLFCFLCEADNPLKESHYEIWIRHHDLITVEYRWQHYEAKVCVAG